VVSPAEAGGQKRKSDKLGPFVLADEMPSPPHLRVFRARYEPEGRDPGIKLAPGESAVVKVLRDAAMRDPAQLAAFSREAELLSMIDHPSIAQGITRGVTAGRMWNAMEYVEGEDLFTLFRVMQQEKIRLRPELVVSLAADLLSGLAAAQSLVDPRGRSLGLIHRDVSPKNVVIDLKGQGKLVDFSSALLSLREEPSHERVGTPGYWAPEQARGDQLTQGVDVYQVGVLMFELLTGERAFPVESYTEKALLQLHADNKRAPWPRAADLPIELKALVDQALGGQPEERPSDAAAFYALVEGLVEDPEESRRRLAVVAKDLVWSNPEKPTPLFVS
jgi:eukaryotic-like serine/threonine-protein kinase